MSQILSFQFVSDDGTNFADQIRCAAFDFAKSAGETGVCLILVSGTNTDESVPVVANLGAKEASIVLPLFDWVKDDSFGTAFGLSDSVYVISESLNQAAMQQVQSAFEKETNLFFFELDRPKALIRGFLLCREDENWIPIPRSAEGAAAAAMVLHRDLETGTMESTIEQPGGILEIGLRKEQGRVLGLSAGGPVEVRS